MPKEITVSSVLNKSKKRDSWFLSNYTFNPYSSCSFNCLYCYIRGSKYGHNLAKSIRVKSNAIAILDKQLALRAKKGEYGYIVLSSATDPYLGIENDYQLTRKALKIILKYRFPVHIITKSNGVTRDFDLLKQIDQAAILPDDLQAIRKGVFISFSFATLDDQIGKQFEPGAPAPSSRLKIVQQTIDTGFLTGISLMPLIPYISDTTEQLELAFSTFKQMGVHYIFPATLTLFGTDKASSKTLFLDAIKKHHPHLMPKYQRFFEVSDEMPAYYRNAFHKKMIEMHEGYGIPNNIPKAALLFHTTKT